MHRKCKHNEITTITGHFWISNPSHVAQCFWWLTPVATVTAIEQKRLAIFTAALVLSYQSLHRFVFGVMGWKQCLMAVSNLFMCRERTMRAHHFRWSDAGIIQGHAFGLLKGCREYLRQLRKNHQLFYRQIIRKEQFSITMSNNQRGSTYPSWILQTRSHSLITPILYQLLSGFEAPSR